MNTKCFQIENLHPPSLQFAVLVKALELTLLQFAVQVRVRVFVPLPHVLLQDDHPVQDVNTGPVIFFI